MSKKVRKCIFSTEKIEVKNIHIIKVDQMIVFYNASMIAHSRIRPFFVR